MSPTASGQQTPLSSVAAPTVPRQRRKPTSSSPTRTVALRVGRILAQIVVGLAVWQVFVTAFGIDPLVMPGPVPVLEALVSQLGSPVVYQATWVTFQEAMAGFAIGAGLAIVLAIVFCEWPLTHRLLNPYVVAFQAIPKVALTPLFIVWFGFGLTSKIVLIATLVFFPVLVNTYVGLTSVDQQQLELMKVSHASRWQTLRHLRAYAALPYLLASFEVSFVLSITAAVFAELLGSGTTIGLGTLVQLFTARLQMPGLFAVIVLLSVLGVLLDVIVKLARKRLVRWGTRGL